MGTAFLYGNGGSGGFGLQIVEGLVRPKNPTQGMVWAKTEHKVTYYDLSATKPENPVEGTLWVTIGDSGKRKIVSPVSKEWVIVYPLSAEQYVNDTWERIATYSYQDGEWVDWITYIYATGDDGNALYVYKPSGSYAGQISTVFDSDGVSLKNTNSSGTYGVRIATNDKIDFTNYSKLCAKVLFNSIGSGGSTLWNTLAATTDRSGQGSKFLASANYPDPSVGEHIYEVDISTIDTSGYAEYCIDAYGRTFDAKIISIWLE